jgi:type 1 fimbriae regulatory protein FimE
MIDIRKVNVGLHPSVKDLPLPLGQPPMTVNGKVVAFPSKLPRISSPPKRRKNLEVRSREHLTEQEVEKLVKAAQGGRYGHRDSTAILLAYRHGLRVKELVGLRWDQIDLRAGTLHVNRVKNGTESTHPLRARELRALRQLRRDWPDSPYVLCSERGGPMTTDNVRKLVARSGQLAGLPFPVHPHMLRHACGFKLANDGQDTRAVQLYLGHRNIQHTVRYTELTPGRFRNFWDD